MKLAGIKFIFFVRHVAAVVATSATSLMFYRYITKHFNKFEKLGIPYEKGHFPSGSFNLLRPDLTHMYEHLAKGRFQKPQARKLSVGGVPPRGLHGREFSEKLAEKS